MGNKENPWEKVKNESYWIRTFGCYNIWIYISLNPGKNINETKKEIGSSVSHDARYENFGKQFYHKYHASTWIGEIGPFDMHTNNRHISSFMQEIRGVNKSAQHVDNIQHVLLCKTLNKHIMFSFCVPLKRRNDVFELNKIFVVISH